MDRIAPVRVSPTHRFLVEPGRGQAGDVAVADQRRAWGARVRYRKGWAVGSGRRQRVGIQ
jgi:hypothetical protein